MTTSFLKNKGGNELDILDQHSQLATSDKERLRIIMKNLRIARIWAKMTQREVAKKIGIKQTTISNWELGRSQPDFLSLLKLCEIYHIRPGDILSDRILEPDNEAYDNKFDQNQRTDMTIEQDDPSITPNSPTLTVETTISTEPYAQINHQSQPHSYKTHDAEDASTLSVAQAQAPYQTMSNLLFDLPLQSVPFTDLTLKQFERYEINVSPDFRPKHEVFLTRAIDDSMNGDHIYKNDFLLCQERKPDIYEKYAMRDNGIALVSVDGQPAQVRRVQYMAEGVLLSASSRNIAPVFIPYGDKPVGRIPEMVDVKAVIICVMIDLR